MILSINYLYWLVEVILTVTVLVTFANKNHPRRWVTGLFWVVFAVIFLAGDRIPPTVIGVNVVVMALLAGTDGVTLDKYGKLLAEKRRALAKRLGNRLSIPTLTIPLATVIGSVFLKNVKIGGDLLLDPKNQTFVSLDLGCITSFVLACWLTRDTPVQAMRESRRLTKPLGWALVLLQMLAMLGLVSTDAGMGKAVAHLTTAYINMDYRLIVMVVYCVGTALFTVIMGNDFAAFPVIADGVGVLILVGVFHTNPAVMAAIDIFLSYCGTPMTPMAANFDTVPTALLELSGKNAVIEAQVPTTLLLPAANIVLLYLLMSH